jgi:hypothetical protein
VGAENFDWIVRAVADMAIARAISAPQPSELRWSAFLGALAVPARTAKKKSASHNTVKAKGVKAMSTEAKKNSKLEDDEEASTAADEPMGSVAAAVSRDQGSSANPEERSEADKKDKPHKPANSDPKSKPVRPSA